MRGKNIGLSRSYGGAWMLSVMLNDASVQEAKRFVDTQKDADYDIVIRPHKDKRSLTANSYFHALCGKMATVLESDIDSVKKHLVLSYGVPAESDGVPVTITLPKGIKADDYYPYCEWIYGDSEGDTYALMKETHRMDTKEFSALLSMTVRECKDLGIETLQQDELDRLYAQIDKGLLHK